MYWKKRGSTKSFSTANNMHPGEVPIRFQHLKQQRKIWLSIGFALLVLSLFIISREGGGAVRLRGSHHQHHAEYQLLCCQPSQDGARFVPTCYTQKRARDVEHKDSLVEGEHVHALAALLRDFCIRVGCKYNKMPSSASYRLEAASSAAYPGTHDIFHQAAASTHNHKRSLARLVGKIEG